MSDLHKGVHFTLSPPKGTESIISTEAIEFLAVLHRTFDGRRKELLENRKKVQQDLDNVCPHSHSPSSSPVTTHAMAKIRAGTLMIRAKHYLSPKRPRRSGRIQLGRALPQLQGSKIGGESSFTSAYLRLLRRSDRGR
jgi:malate synthase